MFAHSYIAQLSRTCYGKLTPYALQKSSVLRWPQKQDYDEDKSLAAAGIESSKLHDHRHQLRDP